MKFIIVGLHGSGKINVLNTCEELGCRVGREFSNLPDIPEQVNLDPKYEHYSEEDITNIFESSAYLCMGTIEESGVKDAYAFQRGISYYTFDNSDIIAISPQQLNMLNLRTKEHVVWVWLDDKRDTRIRRHVAEGRTYDFVEQEELESEYTQNMVKTIYEFPNSSVIYFTDEVPDRVATIINAIIKHPDLLESFEKNFN